MPFHYTTHTMMLACPQGTLCFSTLLNSHEMLNSWEWPVDKVTMVHLVITPSPTLLPNYACNSTYYIAFALPPEPALKACVIPSMKACSKSQMALKGRAYP